MESLIYPHLCLLAYVLPDGTSSEAAPLKFAQAENAIQGTVYCHAVNDTQQWWIVGAIEEKTQARSLSDLGGLQAAVLGQWQQTSGAQLGDNQQVGQSWLVCGVLPTGANPQAIVASVCRELGLDENGVRSGEEWQGAKVFEVAGETSHGVVVLYTALAEMEMGLKETLLDWAMLLQFRHKISWAYGNTRQIKQVLGRHLFPKPSSLTTLTLADEVPTESDLLDLKQGLKRNLGLLSQYTECLSFLELQIETLKTNLTNYQSRSQQMKLQEWKWFEIQTGKRYVDQIERDIATLMIGLRVREKTTDTIRGLVELEQAERDRQLEAQNQRFQNTIAIVGVGLGSASIAAANLGEATVVQALVGQVPGYVREKMPSPWLEGAIAVGVCLGLGCLAAVVLQGLPGLGRRRRK